MVKYTISARFLGTAYENGLGARLFGELSSQWDRHRVYGPASFTRQLIKRWDRASLLDK